MWPPRSDALYVGLSSTRLDWQCTGCPPQTRPLAAGGARLEQAAALLEDPSIPARLDAVHVVAGSSVARHWLQTAPQGLRSLAELQALVQSRADQLFGSDPGWVVAADWHPNRPFLCAALPRTVIDLASAISREKRATPHAATSLSLALSQNPENLPAEGWTVLHEPEALHLLHFSAGELDYLRTILVAAELPEAALEREVATEVERCSALAGGLPTSPLSMLAMSTDPGTSQSKAALQLAAPRWEVVPS